MKEIDDAIARYREELAAEAGLPERDHAEIEDHLRTLIDELRATMPLAEAIALARGRVGDPRAVAREHAQVRTAFGARLSRARAWSAVAMLVPMQALAMWRLLDQHGRLADWTIYAFGSVLAAGMLAALAARLTWARAFVLGGLPFMILWNVAGLVMWPHQPYAALELALNVAALACVAPWRRRELTAAGVGLALLTGSYYGAIWMLANLAPDAPIGRIAVGAVLLGGAGAVLRARWAAPATLAAAALLAAGVAMAWDQGPTTAHPTLFLALLLVCQVTGAAGAALAAALQWRHARSTLGTLRGLS